MHIQSLLKTAISGLKSNKGRTFLTLLGIVIGISAIITIMAVGDGAEQLILKQVEGMGANSVFIDPGKEPEGPSDFAGMYSDSLKIKDIESLGKQTNVQGVEEVSPMVVYSSTVTYGNETKRATILGSSELIAEILEIEIEEGNFFNDEDIKQRAKVAVIGSEIKEDLFGDKNIIGEKIKIKGYNFKVVGVLASKGKASFFDADNAIVSPYTTVQQYLLGINYFHEIVVKVEEGSNISRVKRDIEYTLRENHGITDPDKDDFYVTTQEDAADRVQTIMGVLTSLLLVVASISLVVGGIGIMNIMLVSVTERIREIGLRKALGATEKDILTQFLLEAVIVTGIGGLVGVIFGAFLSFVAAQILTYAMGQAWGFSFPFSAAIVGTLVSAIVGLVFGIYPAYQAAKKDPVEALRHE
jgi:putative ABC transport system permease protein